MTQSWWAKRPAPNQTELICYKNNSWLSPHMLPYSSFYLFVFNHKASSRPHELQSADDTRVFQKTQRQVQKSYFSFFKRVINVMFNLSFDLATLLGSTCSHRDLPVSLILTSDNWRYMVGSPSLNAVWLVCTAQIVQIVASSSASALLLLPQTP